MRIATLKLSPHGNLGFNNPVPLERAKAIWNEWLIQRDWALYGEVFMDKDGNRINPEHVWTDRR